MQNYKKYAFACIFMLSTSLSAGWNNFFPLGEEVINTSQSWSLPKPSPFVTGALGITAAACALKYFSPYVSVNQFADNESEVKKVHIRLLEGAEELTSFEANQIGTFNTEVNKALENKSSKSVTTKAIITITLDDDTAKTLQSFNVTFKKESDSFGASADKAWKQFFAPRIKAGGYDKATDIPNIETVKDISKTSRLDSDNSAPVLYKMTVSKQYDGFAALTETGFAAATAGITALKFTDDRRAMLAAGLVAGAAQAITATGTIEETSEADDEDDVSITYDNKTIKTFTARSVEDLQKQFVAWAHKQYEYDANKTFTIAISVVLKGSPVANKIKSFDIKLNKITDLKEVAQKQTPAKGKKTKVKARTIVEKLKLLTRFTYRKTIRRFVRYAQNKVSFITPTQLTTKQIDVSKTLFDAEKIFTDAIKPKVTLS